MIKSLFFLVCLSLLILGGCASDSKIDPINSYPVLVERTPIRLPESRIAEQYPFAWVIVTPNNYEKKLKEITDYSGAPIIVGLSNPGLENLNLSIAELRRYIENQNAIIQAYKDYYEKLPNKIPKQD